MSVIVPASHAYWAQFQPLIHPNSGKFAVVWRDIFSTKDKVFLPTREMAEAFAAKLSTPRTLVIDDERIADVDWQFFADCARAWTAP